MDAAFQHLDRFVLAILTPLAIAILVSGLDDLVVDAVWAALWLKSKLRPSASLYPPGPRQLQTAPRRRIAILVPLWKEAGVAQRMIEHNLVSIRYAEYDFFAGCYPNDPDTQAEVAAAAARFPNVHVALCPHDGPTSKADCLNWTYQHLLLHEEQKGEHFDVVVVHDAEDVIHPNELTWINYYAARYDFIQTPVLPLPTPLYAITHGVYCDEFAEYHTRDMTVRRPMGGFIPSAGVGTAYRRKALERLAKAASNRVFEPSALTEDYENGLRLARLKVHQAFVPISFNLSSTGDREIMATREYFPQNWSAAVRQRTRWVTGIALQGWERYGWKGRPGEVYWLWRDRKGLLTNPLSLLVNLVFVYGAATSIWTRASPIASRLIQATLALMLVRLAIRMACSARIYGWFFALGAPIRTVYGNLLNSAATFGALATYFTARVRGRPLQWLKTSHAYPNRAALLSSRRRLGEILVGSGYVTAPALEAALATQPPQTRIGDHLVQLQWLSEDALYEALSLQQALPVVRLDAAQVPLSIARAFPKSVVTEWRVLPFRVENGALHVAGPEPPSAKLTAALAPLTALEIRFHLLTPSNFETLASALL